MRPGYDQDSHKDDKALILRFKGKVAALVTKRIISPKKVSLDFFSNLEELIEHESGLLPSHI